MEIPRKRITRRVEQPTIENKNRTYGCSMCDRKFSLIVPPGVGVGTIADRVLFDIVKGEFMKHNQDSHDNKSKFLDPKGKVLKLNA